MKKNIFVIIGSASQNSANEKLIGSFARLASNQFSFKIFNDLKLLPHFDPQLSNDNPPKSIIEFRNYVEDADGVLICTPEYIFRRDNFVDTGRFAIIESLNRFIAAFTQLMENVEAS